MRNFFYQFLLVISLTVFSGSQPLLAMLPSEIDSDEDETINQFTSLIRERGYSIDVFKSKLDAYPELNIDGYNHRRETLLHVATDNGRYDFMRELLKRGANVDAPKNDSLKKDEISLYRKDETPLYTAVWNGDYMAVKILLEHKANPNIVLTSSGCHYIDGTNSILKLAQHERYKFQTRITAATQQAIVDLLREHGAK